MDISAGIVLYNPNISRLEENISAVIFQCAHIYLVDNGSDNIDDILNLLKKFNQSNIDVICNKKNKGIAKALNQLVLAAQNGGYDWILTLDQDSVPPSNIVEEFKIYKENKDVAILCPVILDRNKESPVKIQLGYKEIDECITSGSLLNIEAWNKIGGFDEHMFIDGVDFDICYRLRLAGYKILRVQNVFLLHELGHIEYRRFLIWKVMVKNHSAFRKYYMARNIVYIVRKKKSFLLILKSILQEIKLIGIVLLYEKDKKTKLPILSKEYMTGSEER